MAFVGVQSLAIANLTKSGSSIGSVGPAVSLPIFNTAQLQRKCEVPAPSTTPLSRPTTPRCQTPCAKWRRGDQPRSRLDGELADSRAAVAAAAEAHQMVSKRYQGALATYLDVLVAEDDLISAQRAEAELKRAP